MNKVEIKNLVNCSKPIIFEIGCADGGDTQDFVNVFSGTDFKMYCFEPEPTNIEIFKNRNFNDNIRLTNILDVISNDWEIMIDFGTDVLLKNKTI
jgi:hypothetical protein